MKWHYLLVMMLFVPFASAEGRMKLLAVRDTSGGYEGSIADLYLDIQPGSGRVFLDTFPLTKIDTQMSTRFAKEIACAHLNKDCNNYDFFYTITANSPIIGGPSAGASIAMLTISEFQNKKIDGDIAVTGTINSGGLVGPVGGVKEKIDAAAQAKIKKVMIPKGERFAKEPSIGGKIVASPLNMSFNITSQKNETEIDLVEYGRKRGIEVIEVSSMDEIIAEFTGKPLPQLEEDIPTDDGYKNTMKILAEDLCNRTAKLKKEIGPSDNRTKLMIEDAKNLTERGRKAFEENNYYSSASYCFGANVKYTHSIFISGNLSAEEISQKANSAQKLVSDFSIKLEKREVKTITDLEAKMVVKERLIEAEDYITLTLGENGTLKALSTLSYGIERLYSAYSWYSFFDNRGKKFVIDTDTLKKSCRDKLAEAEERYQYVDLYLPSRLSSARKEIDSAYSDFNKGIYDLCLFKASKAKAEADVVLSVMGVKEDYVDELIEQKLKAVKRVISKERLKGIFPVLGYSYYEYGSDLKNSDKYSALLYSEYALEFSNLDVYFKEKKSFSIQREDTQAIYIFIAGAAAGFMLALTIINKRKKKKMIKTQAEHRKGAPLGKKR